MIGEKYPKSALKVFFKLNLIAPVSGVSNEILCILAAQETAKLPIYQSSRSEKKFAT